MDIDIGKLKADISELMEKHPDNYVFMLHAKCYRDTYGKYVDYINETTRDCLSDPKYKFITKLYWVMHDIKTFPLCEYCHKPILRNVANGIHGYSGTGRFCSMRCAQCSDYHKEKMKKLAREKYGCDSIIGSPQVRKKINESIKKTLENNPNFYKERKEKIEKTCMEKYGVSYPQQNKEIKARTLITSKRNNLKKYGVEFVLQNKEIMEKVKKTNREKYGTDYPLQNKEYQKKICQMAASEESKQKRLQTAIRKYGVSNLFNVGMQNAIYQIHKNSYEHLFSTTTIPQFSFEEYIAYLEMGKNGPLSWLCEECGKKFEMVPFEHYFHGSWVRCLNCHPFMYFGFSQGEKEVLDYVKSVIPDLLIKENDTSVIRNIETGRPLEIDIWIPEIKVAIEYQGEYWHKLDIAIKHDETKRIVCKDMGIRLLQINETDWVNDKENTKTAIKRFILNETT